MVPTKTSLKSFLSAAGLSHLIAVFSDDAWDVETLKALTINEIKDVCNDYHLSDKDKQKFENVVTKLRFGNRDAQKLQTQNGTTQNKSGKLAFFVVLGIVLVLMIATILLRVYMTIAILGIVCSIFYLVMRKRQPNAIPQKAQSTSKHKNRKRTKKSAGRPRTNPKPKLNPLPKTVTNPKQYNPVPHGRPANQPPYVPAGLPKYRRSKLPACAVCKKKQVYVGEDGSQSLTCSKFCQNDLTNNQKPNIESKCCVCFERAVYIDSRGNVSRTCSKTCQQRLEFSTKTDSTLLSMRKHFC